MFGFHDKTAQIDESISERMSFRTKPYIKRTIERAAALLGVDNSAYVMSAAYEAANSTIAAHECTGLQMADCEAFFATIDNPPAPAIELRSAFRRHKETVETR